MYNKGSGEEREVYSIRGRGREGGGEGEEG
jgi:hypothetical protein